ncbi:hypothetical protein FSP39_015607 [Pinctada imbricata]|uniref:Zinc finger protein Rlf/292/654 TPR repeats domain-containing protein n=1 Tax=Pinctada imbricata TaxID=66713 RepID=A0AA88YNB8_PINIB|nr:hypothetical protein FSP39_015607 [Pinctada imbricata]
MDFSALIAELRDIANRYNGRDIDSNVSTAMYCEMFRKILQKAESEVTAYDDQIVILWMTLSQLCQTYQTLTTCNERNSLYQHIFLLCAKVVLNIKWQQLSDDDQSKQNFRATVEATHRQLVTAGFDRFGLLLKLMDNPWTDTTITKIMSGDQDEDDSDSDATEDHDADDEEIKEKEEERKKRKEKRKQQVEEEYSQYINREDPLILHLRVEMLMQENCEEWALNLCECCLRQEKFIRDLEFKMMQLQLLFKLKYLDKLQEVCESITCHVGVALLDRLEGKESNQALVVRLIQIFLVQDWIKPDRNCCTKTLLQIWIKYQLLQDKDREKFLDSVWAIAKLSSRTEQICQLITSLLKKCGMNFIQLYTDLCIYAINVDKSCCEQQMLQGNMEGVRTRQHAISMTCIKLADLYCNCSPKVARIAALTAFSLNPSIQNFNVVRKTYTDKRKEKIQSVKDDYSPQKESKPRQSRHLNKVNPSTLHEVERLLNMLRPYYLDPELPFQRLLPVCQKFMEEKGTFQQAPNKKPAVTSTVSKTTTKPTNLKKGKPKSPVSSDIPTNVQYYCDDTVTLQRQNSNSGVSSTSVAGVDNRLNPISSSTSQHKSPVYQSKSAHQTSVNNLYRQKPVVSVHKDLNSAPQHIRTSDSQNVQMPMGQGTKPPLFGTQPHSYRAIMHTEPAAAQPPPAPKSPIAAVKQPVQRLVPVAELMQSLEVQRLQQVTELQKSKEIERANSITNLLKATKSTPKSQSSASKQQHSQPQSQIKQMELTAIHNTTKAMHMDAIRRHSVHLPVQSVKSPIEERPIPHHISAPKDIDKSQLRPPLNKLRVSSVDASKFTATQKIIPKDLPPGLQHQFPPYGSEKTLTLGAGQSKTPQPFMLKPLESSSSKRRPSADELKSIVDWLQAGTEDAKPQAQPMQPKPAHTGQTAQKLPSFFNPLSSPQPAPAHYQMSQSSSPSMHSIGHSPQATSSPQLGHDLSPAGSLGQNSMAAPGRSSTIHQAATEIQKKLVNLQRQNSTTNNTLGAQLLLNLQKKGLIGTTAAYGAAPPPSPVQTQASSNMHLTQSPAIIPVKPAVTTQPQVTSKVTSPVIQPQLVLSNIQSQVTQPVAQPKVKQPEAESSPLPQMLNPLQMPSKPGQKQLTDKDLSIEEMKLRIAEIVRQQTEAERLNPSTPPKLKRSSSPRQRSPKSRSRSTPTPTKTGAIEQTNVVTPAPSGMDEVPDQLTGSSSLGNLLRHSSVTPKKGKSQVNIF